MGCGTARLRFLSQAVLEVTCPCINSAARHCFQKVVVLQAAVPFGEITRQNADGRRIVERGVPANFFVFYEVDEDESKHSLSLDEYG